MKRFDEIEAMVIDMVAKAAPWLALAPTGYAIGHATYAVIGWPAGMAVVVGLAVESLGIATSATALRLRSYNATRKAAEPAAPAWLGYSLVGVYFSSAMVLTAVLEANPVLALFPLISLTAVVNQALNLDHAQRLSAIATAKEMAKVARQEAKLARQAEAVGMPVAEVGTPAVPVARQWQYEDFETASLARNGKGPLTVAELVEQGVPARTAYRWVKRFAERKVISSN